MKSPIPVLRFAPAFLSIIGFLTLLVTGCVSHRMSEEEAFKSIGEDLQGASEELRPGDVVKISFKGPSVPIPDHEERVPESGKITLPLIREVEVIGKTRVELQDEIWEKYVPKYFKELTVTIAPGDRYFFVYGDVKLPSRYPYGSKLTVTGAISTAGGFTDFGNQKKVLLIRADDRREVVNCKKARENPQYDREVLPGDKIFVPRRLW